jgi:hypothetical protein
MLIVVLTLAKIKEEKKKRMFRVARVSATQVLPGCCMRCKTNKGFLAAFVSGIRIYKVFFFWFSAAAAKQSGG